MFVRKLKSRNGHTQIQVMRKVNRHNQVVKHLGTARNELEITQLVESARQFIDEERIKSGRVSFFDTRYERSELYNLLSRLSFTQALDSLTYQFLLHFYGKIGFLSLQDNCFADLVITRITDPASKRRSRNILEVRFNKRYSLSSIYRTLRHASDSGYQLRIEETVKKFIKERLGLTIAVLYFDVTTLYYEAFDEDDTRKNGFSKDLKHGQPQIVVALTVTTNGIPLSMRMFEGDTFEGHAMLPVITEVMEGFKLPARRIVVVADAAMLSKVNLAALESGHIKYIVGGRLGNLPEQVFDKVTSSAPKTDGASRRFELSKKRILVVSYSAKRAKKDKFDRDKQIGKARLMLSSPSSLLKRYKFIQSSDKDQYQLNQELITKATKLEGLKGYVTNAKSLTNTAVIQKYTGLWQIEKSFRMSKSDLKARPVFHTLKQSIEAHLLIVFTALVIARYIEMVSQKSIAQVITILSQVKEVTVLDNVSGQTTSKYTNFTPEARHIAKLANIDWGT